MNEIFVNDGVVQKNVQTMNERIGLFMKRKNNWYLFHNDRSHFNDNSDH